MLPIDVADVLVAGGRRRLPRVSCEPLFHRVVIELLVPEQAAERLAGDVLGLRQHVRLEAGVVKLVRVANAVGEDAVERRAEQSRRRLGLRKQSEPHDNFLAGRNGEHVIGGRLGADGLFADRLPLAADHELMKGVFDAGPGF